MLKSESFARLEETVKGAQELMARVVEQNRQWPGGGASEEDIVKARGLLKEAQMALVDVGETVVRQLSQSAEVDVMPANDMFDQAYHILNLMYDATRKIRISLEQGESQTKAIRGLEIHLQKFYKHCEETRLYLLEAARVGGEMP